MSTKPTYDFSGKVIFITGASSGIGKSTALAFARAKAKIALIDINQSAGLVLEKQLIQMGLNAKFMQCDVSKEDQVINAVQATIKNFGKIDLAFNNAGIEGVTNLTADTTSENWHQVIQTNLNGLWYCMKYQLTEMLKHKQGSIINCSSIAGLVGFKSSSAYVSAKHAVLGLTKTAALEYAKSGIRINAICPGVIETPMIDRFTKNNHQAYEQLNNSIPMGRLGHPDEIADAVLWLSSDATSYLTGQNIVVDGGWVAQ